MRLQRSLRKRLWRLFPPTVDTSLVKCQSDGEESKVSLNVQGQEVWFSSTDAELSGNPFAFLALFLPHHLSWKTGLAYPYQLPESQRKNLTQIAEKFSSWWSFPHPLKIQETNGSPSSAPTTRGRRAAFFSCGADSFHTVLSQGDQIDDLILVHGFDVPLDDNERFENLRANAQQVATNLGKNLVVIRTNLRTHTAFNLVKWPVSHGPALAAVAHLLEKRISSASIAASYPREYFSPWGSNAQTDPLWSTAQLEIIHHGDDLWRTEKIARWGGHPLVQKHLIVCWEQINEKPNCGECEKCLRTQLALLVHGHLAGNQCFQHATPLSVRIRALLRRPQYDKVYQEFLNHPLPDDIRSAIENWLDTSNRNTSA